MALSPQLPPTDYAALEQVDDRAERERLYAESAIVRHREPQGIRYTKGTNPDAEKRSWQSLDVVLRSDMNSSAALPVKKLRAARILTALAIAASIVTVGGIAASAREGLDLKHLNGTGGVLLGGGLATVAFGIAAGIVYSRARRDYDRAVDIYNDSLGVRLGIYAPDGKYIPPRGVLVDEEGYIILDEPERAITGPREQPAAPKVETPPAETPPAETPPATAPPATTPPTTTPPVESPPVEVPPVEVPPPASAPKELEPQRPRSSTIPPPGLSLRMRP
ncbi:MAG TPA: hypothetical protein VFG69_17675 [Nannocystaceae bacterium]|nr:hypothetical protein [Nannocystaceae bacterium]